MASIDRLVCELTGGPGGLGLMTFFAKTGMGHQPDFKTFVEDIVVPYFPDDVSVLVPSSGDTLDDATGAITAVWSFGTPGTFTGANSGAWAGGVGGRVRWITGARRNNRAVIGTTFIVPAASVVFTAGGVLSSAFQSGVLSQANTLLAAVGTDMVVWSRPNNALGNNGFSSEVTGADVPQQAAWLRSRKI